MTEEIFSVIERVVDLLSSVHHDEGGRVIRQKKREERERAVSLSREDSSGVLREHDPQKQGQSLRYLWRRSKRRNSGSESVSPPLLA